MPRADIVVTSFYYAADYFATVTAAAALRYAMLIFAMALSADADCCRHAALPRAATYTLFSLFRQMPDFDACLLMLY